MRCSEAKWISNNTEKAFAAETLYVDRSFRYDFSIVTCACFSVATTAAVVVAQIRKQLAGNVHASMLQQSFMLEIRSNGSLSG